MNSADYFSHLIGNTKVKGYLANMLDKQTVSQSMLFAGSEGVGKALFARALAAAIMANGPDAQTKILENKHPDLHIYKPEGKIGMHSIGSMREFSKEVYMAPFEARKKVFIIEDAERMVTFSANALLKTFEEPAKDAVIILTSCNPSLLLPTIKSRCTTIHFQAIDKQNLTDYLISSKKLDPHFAKRIANNAQGSVAKALEILEKGDDPLCQAILELLSTPPSTYKQLSQSVKSIAEKMEQRQLEAEKLVRAQSEKIPKESMTATLRDAIEKEVDGAGALQQAREADVVFDTIQGWHRDLHLLSVNGNREYLSHPDYIDDLSNRYEQGNLKSMEEVEKAIKEAKTSLARSTGFGNCLETLLLKVV
jgi:DNA polymerase III subunit delta'